MGDLDTYTAATKLTLSTIVWDCSVRKSTPENGNGTNFENCLSIAVNMYSKLHYSLPHCWSLFILLGPEPLKQSDNDNFLHIYYLLIKHE
jgi:hypothetical protein